MVIGTKCSERQGRSFLYQICNYFRGVNRVCRVAGTPSNRLFIAGIASSLGYPQSHWGSGDLSAHRHNKHRVTLKIRGKSASIARWPMYLCKTVDDAALDQAWSVNSRSPCLLLNDHRTAADFRSGHKVADPELQQIAAPVACRLLRGRKARGRRASLRTRGRNGFAYRWSHGQRCHRCSRIGSGSGTGRSYRQGVLPRRTSGESGSGCFTSQGVASGETRIAQPLRLPR